MTNPLKPIPEKRPLKLAVVGSGGMARAHSNHWRKIPEVQLAAIASPDQATAHALAGAEAAELFPSLEDLLASPSGAGIDIVDICLPTPLHVPAALQALDAGKHLLLEKPMARTTADCDRIIAAAERAGTMAMVAQVVRYFPEYANAHRQVKTGAVGTPAVIRAARLGMHPKAGWNNWYADQSASGGVVLDLIIHDFDWLLWTFGPVERVFAKGLYKNPEYAGLLDYALVTLRHASGALSHVTGSWAHPSGFRTTFEICGDAGMIEHDSAAVAPLALAQREPDGARPPGVPIPESPMAPYDDPYYKELRHFTDCVLTGAQPDIKLAESRAAVRIAEAALESIDTGKPVVP